MKQRRSSTIWVRRSEPSSSVGDARAVHRQAVAAGGVSISEVTHLAFGDLVGRVRDPFGNVWWIQTHIEDVTPEEMERRFGDPGFTAAMEYMQRPETEFFSRGIRLRG